MFVRNSHARKTKFLKRWYEVKVKSRLLFKLLKGKIMDGLIPGCSVLSCHWLTPRQSFEQFTMNAAKAAVAEDHHHIAALRIFGHVRDDGVGVRKIGGVFA